MVVVEIIAVRLQDVRDPRASICGIQNQSLRDGERHSPPLQHFPLHL